MELKIRKKSTFLTIQNDTSEIFVQHIQIQLYSAICRSYYSWSCLKVPNWHPEFGGLGFMGFKVGFFFASEITVSLSCFANLYHSNSVLKSHNNNMNQVNYHSYIPPAHNHYRKGLPLADLFPYFIVTACGYFSCCKSRGVKICNSIEKNHRKIGLDDKYLTLNLGLKAPLFKCK